MEKHTRRYTVTTVLEYDRDGDVVREEHCEDTEYYEPDYPGMPGLVKHYPSIFDGFAQVDPSLKKPVSCDTTSITTTAPLIDAIRQ